MDVETEIAELRRELEEAKRLIERLRQERAELIAKMHVALNAAVGACNSLDWRPCHEALMAAFAVCSS